MKGILVMQTVFKTTMVFLGLCFLEGCFKGENVPNPPAAEAGSEGGGGANDGTTNAGGAQAGSSEGLSQEVADFKQNVEEGMQGLKAAQWWLSDEEAEKKEKASIAFAPPGLKPIGEFYQQVYAKVLHPLYDVILTKFRDQLKVFQTSEIEVRLEANLFKTDPSSVAAKEEALKAFQGFYESRVRLLGEFRENQGSAFSMSVKADLLGSDKIEVCFHSFRKLCLNQIGGFVAPDLRLFYSDLSHRWESPVDKLKRSLKDQSSENELLGELKKVHSFTFALASLCRELQDGSQLQNPNFIGIFYPEQKGADLAITKFGGYLKYNQAFLTKASQEPTAFFSKEKGYTLTDQGHQQSWNDYSLLFSGYSKTEGEGKEAKTEMIPGPLTEEAGRNKILRALEEKVNKINKTLN